MKHIILLLLINNLLATENIYKFDTTNFSGTITSSTKTFDRFTGTLYIGTDNTGGGDNAYAISSASRTTTAFTPLAYNSLVFNQKINAVDILGSNPTHLASVTETTSCEVLLLKLSDKSVNRSGLLYDSTPAICDHVSLITTSSNHIFARIVQNGGNESSGNNNGIANIKKVNDNLLVVQGSGSNPSLSLNPNDSEVSPGTVNVSSHVVNDIIYDPDLNTLFIGSTIIVPATGGPTSKIGVAIVKAKFGVNGASTGEIGREYIVSDFTTFTLSDITNIFAYRKTTGSAEAVNINKIRVMTTTTGYKYLIVNGGVTSVGTNIAGNKFYSLRISQTGTGAIDTGDIIKNDTLNETPLPTNTTGLNALQSAIVGAGDAPWDNTTTCSDIVVIDNTVYVSVKPPQRTGTNDPGIWKSQAMFSHEGLISAWTPWEKVFPVGDNTNGDNTPCFDVDARTGKIWRIDNTGKIVTRSKWNTLSNTVASLQYQLGQSLSDGCYTVLDLPNETPGIGDTNNTDNSITIFGGFEKVVFARNKQGNSNNITLDYSTGDNFLETTSGLSGFGPIRCLGYSYNTKASQGYFFAGTNKGLFAYAPSNGAGYDANTGITDLNTGELFGAAENSYWQPIADSILTETAAISQIITCTDDRIYLLVLDTTSIGAISDQLYELPLKNSISDMTPRLIAASSKGGLPNNAAISGCAILTTTNSVTANDTRMGCFGVLSTNDGIYTSTCDLRFLAGINNHTITTEWESVTSTTGMAIHSIQRHKDHRKQAFGTGFYPFRPTNFFALVFVDDLRGFKVYEDSTVLQAGITGNAIKNNAKQGITTRAVQANPVNLAESVRRRRFALNSDRDTFKTIDFTTLFYTDGARRFFSICNLDYVGIFNTLRTLPYRAPEWDMIELEYDRDLSDISRIYWIENISGTGQLMAGVDSGVIVLE